MNSYFSREELEAIGFQSLGTDVLISRNTGIYGAGNIRIGNHVRIDDFSILSGNIRIGDYVHIAAACLLFGGNSGIEVCDFVGISSRSAVYADSDDSSGEALTNPMIPDEYRNVIGGRVKFEKHALIGTGCTILPGVTVGEGSSVGSMSLINKSLEPWGMYVGIPCKRLKARSRKLLELEHSMMQNAGESFER